MLMNNPGIVLQQANLPPAILVSHIDVLPQILAAVLPAGLPDIVSIRCIKNLGPSSYLGDVEVFFCGHLKSEPKDGRFSVSLSPHPPFSLSVFLSLPAHLSITHTRIPLK